MRVKSFGHRSHIQAYASFLSSVSSLFLPNVAFSATNEERVMLIGFASVQEFYVGFLIGDAFDFQFDALAGLKNREKIIWQIRVVYHPFNIHVLI